MIKFDGYKNSNGSYCIALDNIRRFPKLMTGIPKIIDFYSCSDQLFIGTYKIDGLNIPRKSMSDYELEISNYFKTFGDYYCLPPNDSKSMHIFSSDLTAFKSYDKQKTYTILNKMFDFFLETNIFDPCITWEQFKAYHSDYTKPIAPDYVLNGFTEFMFSFVDSSDFIISFNPQKHIPETIETQVKKILDIS